MLMATPLMLGLDGGHVGVASARVTSFWQTPTQREASFTCTTAPVYCGSIFTAV